MQKYAYDYRGLLIDSGRYFIPVNDMIKILDEMKKLNLNILHWHLTEDQGWRIEIKAFERLTQIGSYRSHTNFNRRPHSGFYTQQDIKQIVDYAHSLGIKIMPEIDLPGHSVAAIAAYPELSCFNRKLNVATHWGVKHDVLCAGKESTYDFYRKVFDEIAELFPDGMIHLGGDEVPKTRWKICPHCQQKIKDNSLADEEALQDYFMDYFADYLAEKGFETYRWANNKTDMLKCKKSIPMYYGGGKAPVDMPHIDCAGDAYYFDLPYGYVPYKSTAAHRPSESCTGVECCLWGEYIPDWKTGMKRLYPRAYAFSQLACEGNVDKSKYDNDSAYNPNSVKAFFSKLYFEKRQLTWQGLTILIDNVIVKKKYKQKNRS
ncbi:MAG: beta-N-acetylhexosaminidase [Eubacterium sp.]